MRCGTFRADFTRWASATFDAGAWDSAAARSRCVAAFLISAAERGPTSQAAHVPLSTAARMVLATILFGGGAFTRRTAYIVCVCARA